MDPPDGELQQPNVRSPLSPKSEGVMKCAPAQGTARKSQVTADDVGWIRTHLPFEFHRVSAFVGSSSSLSVIDLVGVL